MIISPQSHIIIKNSPEDTLGFFILEVVEFCNEFLTPVDMVFGGKQITVFPGNNRREVLDNWDRNAVEIKE